MVEKKELQLVAMLDYCLVALLVVASVHWKECCLAVMKAEQLGAW